MGKISNRLLAHTKRAAETQSLNTIAREANVQVGTLSRWLRGERDINLETAERLATYFGLELRQTKRN